MNVFRVRCARAVVAATTVGLCVVTVAAGPAGAVARSKPPKPFTSDSIVIQKSLGGITLGSTLAAASKRFPAKDCSSGGCSYTTATYSVNFVMAQRRVHSKPFVGQVSLNATKTSNTPATQLRTSKGIGIGSTARQLKKAYPQATGSRKDGYVLQGRGQHETIFDFTGKHVSYIQLHNINIG